MNNIKTIAVASLAGLLSAGVVALATQTNYLGTVFIADTTTPSNQLKVNSDGSINVDGTFSGTVGPFAPGGAFAHLTSSAASADVALPAGTVAALFNTGTSAVSCTLTVGAGSAAANENIIQPGSWFAATVGSNTHYSCINQAGDAASNVVVASGGTGLPAGAGGGSSSGGSSGAVFGPTAVGSAAANPPVLTGGTADGTATGNVAVWKIVSGVGYLNIAQVNGVTTLAGAGAVGTGSQRVAVGQDTTTIAGSAPGTAGTPSTNVVSIQGVSSGTTVPVTLQASATTAIGKVDPNTIATWGLTPVGGTTSSPTNAELFGCQYNSSAPTYTTGDSGAVQCTVNGYPIVNVANALTALVTNADSIAPVTSVTPTAGSSPVNSYLYGFDGTNWDRARVDSAFNLKVNVANSGDPCMGQAKTNVAIGGAGGNIQLVAGVSAKKVYLCSLSLIAAATAVVNIIEGTGAACTTANEAAVIGSMTAASGMSLAANGGLTLGNGSGTVGVTATAANGLCLLQSGTTALAGNATFVQQ